MEAAKYQYDDEYLKRVVAQAILAECGKRDDMESMSLVSHRYDLNQIYGARVAVINMESVSSSRKANSVMLSYVVTPAARHCD